MSAQPQPARYGMLAVGDIEADEELWPRIALNDARVREFAALYREHIAAQKSRKEAGALPPPVVVTRWRNANGRHVLVDGFHRLAAAAEAGVARFQVEFSDAEDDGEVMDEALARTALSPLSPRPADRRKAIVAFLTAESAPSHAEIARRCGVTRQAVSVIAKRLNAGEDPDAIVLGAAGGARSGSGDPLQSSARTVLQSLGRLHEARGGVLGSGIGRTPAGDVARELAAMARKSFGERAGDRLAEAGALLTAAADLAKKGKI